MDNLAIARFDEEGTRLAGPLPAVPRSVTDLFILAHGWIGDDSSIAALYEPWAIGIATGFFNDPAFAGRRPFFVGVRWPSKKFDARIVDDPTASAGGAASLSASARLTAGTVLEDLKNLLDGPQEVALVDQAKELVSQLASGRTARAEFIGILRQLAQAASSGGPGADAADDASDTFFADDPEELLARMKSPVLPPRDPAESGAGITAMSPGARPLRPGDSTAAGIGDTLAAWGRSALHYANYLTYYVMKERAGVVGQTGVAALIDELAPSADRIHLVGHSFGGRVVAAAALGAAKTSKLRSLSLLQTAFSHNGFSSTGSGYFRKVLEDGRVNGPIIVTHSYRDKAVGVAYPLASRIAGDMRRALGDKNDPFGAIGRNGAQKTPRVRDDVPLLPVGKTYPAFTSSTIYNLNADETIMNHGDVTRAEVLHAVVSAAK